jgi:hypothetical protein
MTTTEPQIRSVNAGLADSLEALADHLRDFPNFPNVMTVRLSTNDTLSVLLEGDRGDGDRSYLLDAAATLVDTSWSAELNETNGIWHVAVEGYMGDVPLRVKGQLDRDAATSAAELCNWFAAQNDEAVDA